MASFIEGCRCKGRRPKGVTGTRHVLRSEITGRLLADRTVPRVIVAPKGYGKTAVAHEYAQIVFGYDHVFWIDCKSPCFIRDLDSDSIFDQMVNTDAAARLAVFEDVPTLEDERVRLFKELADSILDSGCEMLATCVPSNAGAILRNDALVLNAFDLLLSDDELEIERARGNISSVPSGVRPCDRAACLVWSTDGAKQLLSGLACESMPGDMRLAAFAILALQNGTFSDLIDIVDGNIDEVTALLAANYPFLGIDIKHSLFDSIEGSLFGLTSRSSSNMEELVFASCLDTAEELCVCVASKLLSKGDASRACEFITLFGSNKAKDLWLRKYGEMMLGEGEAREVVNLCTALRSAPKDLHAWALHLLGEDAEALRLCQSIKPHSNLKWKDVAAALLLSLRLGASKEFVKQSFDSARILESSFEEEATKGSIIDWKLLYRLVVNECDPNEINLQERIQRESASDGLSQLFANTYLLACTWKLEDTKEQHDGEGVYLETDSSADNFLSCALTLIENSYELAPIILHACVNTLESLGCTCEIGYDAKAIAYKVRASLSAQKVAYRRDVATEKRRKANRKQANPGIVGFSRDAASQHAPTLKVSLFGGLDVHIGTGADSMRTLNRRKAKVALAELAVSRGREVSWERITSLLWPDTDADFRKRNFYVIWGYLKNSLAVSGQCPYLIRTQTGFKLDERFLACDIDAFDSLCKALIFGGNYGWDELYDKVSRDFSGDFLPEVTGSEHVDNMRRVYREQLIDGLISAAARLAEEGEARGSLWFAREALRRDELREDSYLALMEAQVASNQRGAAIDTFFECRRALSERLGIDPSPRVMKLYNSIIDPEDDGFGK